MTELLEDWEDVQILEFAAGFVKHHFEILRYPHSAKTHSQLLEDLENPRIQNLIAGALVYDGSNPGAELDISLSLIKRAISELEERVLPDGQRRAAALKAMRVRQ